MGRLAYLMAGLTNDLYLFHQELNWDCDDFTNSLVCFFIFYLETLAMFPFVFTMSGENIRCLHVDTSSLLLSLILPFFKIISRPIQSHPTKKGKPNKRGITKGKFLLASLITYNNCVVRRMQARTHVCMYV